MRDYRASLFIGRYDSGVVYEQGGLVVNVIGTTPNKSYIVCFKKKEGHTLSGKYTIDRLQDIMDENDYKTFNTWLN